MKAHRLPAWATRVMQRMFPASRFDAAVAANLKELGYGG
jgi:hypothetical protein